jgi:hypothetical protein
METHPLQSCLPLDREQAWTYLGIDRMSGFQREERGVGRAEKDKELSRFLL